MDKNNSYKEMSNSELKLKLSELENEYNALKFKVNQHINRMNDLNEAYSKIKEIIFKRNKGIFL